MKQKLTTLFFALCALVALPLATQASSVPFTVSLLGTNQVPPNFLGAAGSGSLTFDDVANTVSFQVTAVNLHGSAVAAHIHAGPAGVNGGVQFDLLANADVSGPITIGTTTIPNSFGFIGTSKPIAHSLILAIFAAPLNFYVNLHTSVFPSGEIRGQIAPVPLPPAVWLLGSALAGVGLLRRRTV